MPKTKSIFICNACGATSPQWLGKCPQCLKFGTLIEEITTTPSTSGSKNKRERSNFITKALPIDKIHEKQIQRTSTGLEELDTVLGGGIVQGSLILLGGDPGIGKSTILTQVMANLSQQQKVLYVCAEESTAQVKMRCTRLNLNAPNLYLLNETCIEDILESITDEKFVVIDSIQTVYTSELSSVAGSVGQIRECASKIQKIAKSREITFFLVGHVTKEGSLAGPKVLEHIMDTVLYFEGELEEQYKVLRAVKNRFGSIMEVGVFEMTSEGLFGIQDYSGLFLSQGRGKASGCSILPTQTGNRCMMVELQTLLAKTPYGMPRRMPIGIDQNKLILLIALLEKRCNLSFHSYDVYMNAMGGIKINEPAIDLAICSALISAIKDKPIDGDTALFGEVGLTGEIRATQFAEKRINEAIKMGFKRIIFPKKNYTSVQKFQNSIELIPVSYISQIFEKLFS